MRFCLFLLALVLASSCSSFERDFCDELDQENCDWKREAYDSIDKKACKDRGGRIEGVGIVGTPACVEYYEDSGKSCTDHSDCLGICRTEIGETVAAASCAGNSANFGCFSTVENGEVSESVCVD